MAKWDIDTTEGVFWIACEAAKSFLFSMEKEVGVKFNEVMLYYHNYIFEWCTLEDENRKVGLFLVEKFKENKFAKKYAQKYMNFYNKCVAEMDSIDKKNLANEPDDKLFKLLEKANKYYIKNFDFGFIIEPMDFVLPELIQPRLHRNNYNISEISDMMAIVDTTFLNREKQGLINIAMRPAIKQNKLLYNHAYNYRWLQSAHMGRKDIPLSYFKNNLQEIKKQDLKQKIKFLKNFAENEKKRKFDLFRKKPVDKETKILINIADIISPFHDKRKELFLRTVYSTDTIRMEIARRYGYTNEQLSVFEVKDIFKLKEGIKLDKKFAEEIIKEGIFYANRKKNIWTYYYGLKAKKFARKEFFWNLEGISEIKGQIASVGKVKGKVKIIHRINEISKIKKGDILVASMTRPEFISAMEKAAAIITDEGGVTSHAAIISRELEIPCIIGTKIATKVLKDGDVVEVDANSGIVRVLK